MAPKAAVAVLYVLLAVSALTMMATVALGPDNASRAVARALAAFHIAGSNEPIHLTNYQAHLRQVMMCTSLSYRCLIGRTRRMLISSRAASTTTTTKKCRDSFTPLSGRDDRDDD